MFLEQLETVKLRPEYTELLRLTVIDAYQKRASEARRTRQQAESRLGELRQRQDRLEEAFIFQRAIDQKTYDEQRDRLREEITVAELALHESTLEELDVDGILGFAETLLQNAANLWKHSEPAQRQRLQRAIFPEGIVFDGERFGTAVTCLAFCQLHQSDSCTAGVASPAGFEPAF